MMPGTAMPPAFLCQVCLSWHPGVNAGRKDICGDCRTRFPALVWLPPPAFSFMVRSAHRETGREFELLEALRAQNVDWMLR